MGATHGDYGVHLTTYASYLTAVLQLPSTLNTSLKSKRIKSSALVVTTTTVLVRNIMDILDGVKTLFNRRKASLELPPEESKSHRRSLHRTRKSRATWENSEAGTRRHMTERLAEEGQAIGELHLKQKHTDKEHIKDIRCSMEGLKRIPSEEAATPLRQIDQGIALPVHVARGTTQAWASCPPNGQQRRLFGRFIPILIHLMRR